jgi:glycosyltransferase involved in cell wall biosynthesis
VTVPLVSVTCITYNQVNFIRETLDGFLMQKTDFPFEVLINDDSSTDGTAEILAEYQSKHPDIIRVVFHDENQFSQGKRGMFARFLFPIARGKYIALCEGDDYWTDPHKLQIQADYMESHPECTLCFHQVKVVYDNEEKSDQLYPEGEERSRLTRCDLISVNFVGTNSVMYRKHDYADLSVDVMPTDLYLHLFHARFGEIHFIERAMSVYRRHAGGIWWGEDVESFENRWLAYGLQLVNTWVELEKVYDGCDAELALLDDRLDEAISALIGVDRKYRRGLTAQLMSRFPDVMQNFLYREVHASGETRQALSIEQNRWREIQSSRVWRTRAALARLARRVRGAGR